MIEDEDRSHMKLLDDGTYTDYDPPRYKYSRTIRGRVELPPEEIARREAEDVEAAAARPGIRLAEIRKRRNELLAETDFHALPDRTLTAEMTAYRKALRDVPQNISDPLAFDWQDGWPTKPE